ncbi:MAG: hypothetical protein QF918_11320 [Pirellulaceae bacterium]|nr:hypothetical protein [Pirellulaceae bacterium]MDP6554096.1 hypothetical protein [Pirellulaceae bacterium]
MARLLGSKTVALNTNNAFNRRITYLEMEPLPLMPGDAVVLHDKLLHRGALNVGHHTRASLEFTMFVKRQVSAS